MAFKLKACGVVTMSCIAWSSARNPPLIQQNTVSYVFNCNAGNACFGAYCLTRVWEKAEGWLLKMSIIYHLQHLATIQQSLYFFIYVFLFLFFYLSVFLFICLPARLLVGLSVCLSICLSVSVYLSLCLIVLTDPRRRDCELHGEVEVLSVWNELIYYVMS